MTVLYLEQYRFNSEPKVILFIIVYSGFNQSKIITTVHHKEDNKSNYAKSNMAELKKILIILSLR